MQPRTSEIAISNVLRGFFASLGVSILTVSLLFWFAPEENTVAALFRYIGFLALLLLGILGLFHRRFRSFAIGVLVFCLLLDVPVFILLVNLMNDRQAMRPL